MSREPDVLVTGSSGHLGVGLMLHLPQFSSFTPIGLDMLPSEYTSIVGSITDRTLIADVFERWPSIRYVLHTATLHKPHIGSHSKEAFIETNVQGTLVLLEEASRTGRIEAFIFTSTTSTFGAALAPAPGEPAAWIDESVVPIPKNIYGVTKMAAEDMCKLIHDETNMPILVLKVSRFFPEHDDSMKNRLAYYDNNLKVCELMYRRVDICDVVDAHVCAMRKAREIGWGKYIISAPSPFSNNAATLQSLGEGRVKEVVKRVSPEEVGVFHRRGWKFPDRIDRVYDSSKAQRELGWTALYPFWGACIRVGLNSPWQSNLALEVGKRGYHAVPTGVYTT
ncbi:hypothetical protein LTR37_005513 [Vermiconidia calcicola]|uniref:Uncharacterized protein n=1 Tax=Vermiconidia calcicola TaxID=1690605 RepID=A0ACC3NJ50_9PEZI|nr:hypothetical protein LTR37_005513 [Vermiconidia calcicola]